MNKILPKPYQQHLPFGLHSLKLIYLYDIIIIYILIGLTEAGWIGECCRIKTTKNFTLFKNFF